jgi:hypothetical protein
LQQVSGEPLTIPARSSLTVAPSLLGIMLGGYLADRLVTRATKWRAISLAGMLLLGVPTFLVLLATP